MKEVPQPNALASAYDAWNRLVELSNSGPLVATYEYDGLHRRIVRHTDTDGDDYLEPNGNDDHRHFYYNENWQCVAETVEVSGTETADALYTHHSHYIDAVACRLGPGANDAIYYCHDANFNVVAYGRKT